MIKRGIILILTLYTYSLVFSIINSESTQIPYKRIAKTIKKQFSIEDYQLTQMSLSNKSSIDYCIFKISSDTATLGFVYINRVKSCRSGGCELSDSFESPGFEYFDYYFVTDYAGKILKVKIYNYQATKGHQVMSKGWLNQFIGYNGNQSLDYGKDVQAISGATVSATNLLNDIKYAEDVIQGLLEK